ncbi:MAG: geranyl transferase [Gammaproteobacteria bacterium]|nr:MAG: geranyl transferase [Gammaproteobacteria bacterium]
MKTQSTETIATEADTVEELLDQYACRVNQQLKTKLPQETDSPITLHKAMRYSVLGGGKRIRPALVYATGEALSSNLESLDCAACAVELMHSYSLIHDDLPAMDDDDLRRGRPTCHKAFDEATAILAGDAIQAQAFAILASDDATYEQRVHMILQLAKSSGSLGMAGGQAIDLAAVNKQLNEKQIRTMHTLKTAALIQASVLMAVITSDMNNPETFAHFAHFSEKVGLAFQIRDDILDIQADTETLGKPQGSDAAQNKPTYPSIVGVEQAENTANNLLQEALNEIDHLDDRAENLREISQYMVTRNS